MAGKKSISYKRDKNKVEINGDPDDIKGVMWFDLISSRLWGVLPIVLLFVLPKGSVMLMLWQWVKKSMFLFILFAVMIICELPLWLSG
ncbi:MAG TPA: hypothetical protein VNS58_05080 [Puia sp.]|nr:hypothetical protein [Puia sp.]